MKAKTPKGKTVTVETQTFGTANLEEGKIYYGTLRVAHYCQNSRAANVCKNLPDALTEADIFIDKYGLEI